MPDEYDDGLPDSASIWIPGEGVPIPGPQGPTGPTGPAPNITIGSVTQGTTASATLTGTSPNYTLNLVLPQGPQGNSGTPGGVTNFTVGTVTALATGATPTVVISGTAPNYIISFGLPAGPQGTQGTPGTASRIVLGNGVPAAGLGNISDNYVDLLTGDMYGPKTTGGWGSIVGNFKGIPDAPADDKLYGRQSVAGVMTWVEIVLTP